MEHIDFRPECIIESVLYNGVFKWSQWHVDLTNISKPNAAICYDARSNLMLQNSNVDEFVMYTDAAFDVCCNRGAAGMVGLWKDAKLKISGYRRFKAKEAEEAELLAVEDAMELAKAKGYDR
ncbi:hypothetical protein FRX31_029441, partial [Thalictrum thalictroides]